MNPRYIPSTHDPILTKLHTEWKLTDHEIAQEMGFSAGVIHYHRVGLGLPANLRPKKQTPPEIVPSAPKSKENPLQLAKAWLGFRLVEKRSGREQQLGFWLDGRPQNLDAIMRATNRLIKEHGGEQISYNETWRV